MRGLLSASLVLVLFGWVTPAPADDPEVPERYITVDQAKAMVDQKKQVTFVDVRPHEQYDEIHIRGAVNIPFAQLRDHLAEVPKGGPVVLY